jgi:hypothetical protein
LFMIRSPSWGQIKERDPVRSAFAWTKVSL